MTVTINVSPNENYDADPNKVVRKIRRIHNEVNQSTLLMQNPPKNVVMVNRLEAKENNYLYNKYIDKLMKVYDVQKGSAYDSANAAVESAMATGDGKSSPLEENDLHRLLSIKCHKELS